MKDLPLSGPRFRGPGFYFVPLPEKFSEVISPLLFDTHSAITKRNRRINKGYRVNFAHTRISCYHGDMSRHQKLEQQVSEDEEGLNFN